MSIDGGPRREQNASPEFNEAHVQQLMADVRVFRKQYSWRVAMQKALDQFSDYKEGRKRSAMLKELGRRFGERGAPVAKPKSRKPDPKPITKPDPKWNQPSLPW